MLAAHSLIFTNFQKTIQDRKTERQSKMWPDGGTCIGTAGSPVHQAVLAYRAAAQEAETVLGSDFREVTDNLFECVGDVSVAIESFIENERSGGRNFETDPQFGTEVRGTLRASPNDRDNPLNQKLDTSYREVERQLAPHLPNR